MNQLLALLQGVGSLFVKRNNKEGGKLDVATVPVAVLVHLLVGIGCYTQEGELFSACFKTVMSTLMP